jgi:hypothetical protein
MSKSRSTTRIRKTRESRESRHKPCPACEQVLVEVQHLHADWVQLMATAADLMAAVTALAAAVAQLKPPLITQGELDQATQGVQAATQAITAQTPQG